MIPTDPVIVHCDIKPSNVAFSQSFNKAVFLDFGCASIVSSGVGTKSLVNFCGSLDFCSDDMKRNFVKD